MDEQSKTHLNSEITRHFRLLKNATYLFGSLVTICLLPLIGLLWSLKAEQIEMSKDFIKQDEVYNNFVNKGQYIYLEGERIKSFEHLRLGADPAKEMSEWGKQVKDALDMRYRGK